MYDALCTGITCCDLIFTELQKFPELGIEVAGKDFLIKAGGAANAPMALAKLGLKTVFATTLGTDPLGMITYDYMMKSGLDLSAVARDAAYRTSVSAVLSVGYERGFASYFAASTYGAMTRKIEEFLPNCKFVYTYLWDCMNMPVVELSKSYGKTVLLDTSWDDSIKLADIKHLIRQSDVFLTNEIEAYSITGTDQPMEAMKALKELNDFVVIKLGDKGSMLCYLGEITYIPAVKNIPVLDTTGAGDLFGAGLLYGLSRGWNPKKAACFASASGGTAVTFYGGMDESYSLETVEQHFRTVFSETSEKRDDKWII